MHTNASKLVQLKNIPPISQTELAMTLFGFMGYALIRPHYFGIRDDCVDDREAFVYFWAVIAHMLGIQERYNMCLLALPTVEIICSIVMQYFFTPFLHFETSNFRQMVMAILDGMSDFLPNMTYDFQMFRLRRIAGVTGYRYRINSEKDWLCRQVFNELEMDEIRQFMMHRYGYDFTHLLITADGMVSKRPIVVTISPNDGQKQMDQRESNNNDLERMANDAKFKELGIVDKFRVNTVCLMVKFYRCAIGWHILELGLSVKLYMMKKYHEQNGKQRRCMF